jgi:hypothetical protein
MAQAALGWFGPAVVLLAQTTNVTVLLDNPHFADGVGYFNVKLPVGVSRGHPAHQMHNCLSLILITCRLESSAVQFEQESRRCSVKRGGRVHVGPSLMIGRWWMGILQSSAVRISARRPSASSNIQTSPAVGCRCPVTAISFPPRAAFARSEGMSANRCVPLPGAPRISAASTGSGTPFNLQNMDKSRSQVATCDSPLHAGLA